MNPSFDFIGVSDRPALLALTSPEWQEIARAALTELGYKVHQAAAHADFIANFTQVPYEVTVIEENFAADNIQENRSLEFLRGAQMSQRRHSTIVLVGDTFTSFDVFEALRQGVHLVVNRSEMLVLIQFIQKAAAENQLFLQPYREAQRRLAAA